MGYASYTEDINDRRFEALAAQQWLQREYSKPAPRVTAKPQPPAPPVTIKLQAPAPSVAVKRQPPAPAIVLRAESKASPLSAADRSRQMRDVHVLCLAELRPKARPEYHLRS